MNLTKLVTILGSAALLAGCGGGGGGGTAPSSLGTNTTTNTNGVATGLAIKVSNGTSKGSSNKRSAKQITTDVTTLLIQIDGVQTMYELTPTLSPSCSGTSPNYTCDIVATAGSHQVLVYTETGTGPYTPVGYSIPQDNVTVTLGQVTPLTFTLTPLASGFSGSTTTPPASYSIPEDGLNHAVQLTADVLAENGQVINSPIDTLDLFGLVSITTAGNQYPVTQAGQAPLNAVTGAYNDGPYSFTYDGSQIAGDSIGIYGAFAENHNDTAVPDQTAVENSYNAYVTAPSSPALIFSIPLTRLNLPPAPNPAGASIGGTTFDPTNSWYYYPPNNGSVPTVPEPNNSNTAVVVFNGAVANTAFVLNVTETNDTNPMTVNVTGCSTTGPLLAPYTTTGSPNGMMALQIFAPQFSGQTTPCVITIVDGAFATVTQSITVFPSSGSYAIYTQSLHRH